MKLSVALVAILFSVTLNAQTIPEKIQQGMSLLNAGKIEEARNVLSQVIQENPKNGAARFLLGQIAIERSQWSEAEEHLKIAVDANPRRPHLVWHLFGKLHLLQHRHSEARQAFDESLRQAPDFVPALIGRARSALFLKDTTAALADLQRASSLQSEETVLLFTESLIYLKRDAEASNALTSFPFKEPEMEAISKILLDLIQANEPSLRKYAAQHLGQDTGYFALGVMELRKNNKEPAASLFQTAFHLNDQNPVTYLFLKDAVPEWNVSGLKLPQLEVAKKVASAEMALKDGQTDAARAVAEQILSERPMHIQAALIMIEVAERDKNYWEAFARYQKLLESIPAFPILDSRFALVAHKMEAHDLAQCYIRRAIESEPAGGYYHYIYAMILKSQQNLDRALEEAEKSIALGFDQAAVYVTLGDIYYEKMEISKSIASLAKAIERDPRAAEKIASFALSALTTEDHSALQEILEKHAQANPENMETLYGLAMMHSNENDLPRAKEYFTALEKLAPNQSEVYYNLALVNFRLGLQDQGERAMARFQELKQKEQAEWLRQNGAHRLRIEAADAMQSGNAAESIRVYRQLASAHLAKAEDWIGLGKAYLEAGKPGEALDSFERALEQFPYNREALAGAAKAANATGKKDVAALNESRLKMLTASCK
jgi:tetratricopeptide (TPR) repeat protein